MSDPKLKEAMAEIVAVLKKHDIAGAVTLVSPTHAEFRYHLEASWSAAYFQGEGHFRFRAKRADFATDEGFQYCIESTVHLVCQIRDISAQNYAHSTRMLDMIQKHISFEHTPFADFEPHREN